MKALNCRGCAPAAAASVTGGADGRDWDVKSSVAARWSWGTAGASSAGGLAGERDWLLLRPLGVIRFLMKPPMEEVLVRPRGTSSSVESEDTDKEVSGLACSSIWLEMEEMVELRFIASGVFASVGVRGGTMPSKER